MPKNLNGNKHKKMKNNKDNNDLCPNFKRFRRPRLR